MAIIFNGRQLTANEVVELKTKLCGRTASKSVVTNQQVRDFFQRHSQSSLVTNESDDIETDDDDGLDMPVQDWVAIQNYQRGIRTEEPKSVENAAGSVDEDSGLDLPVTDWKALAASHRR